MRVSGLLSWLFIVGVRHRPGWGVVVEIGERPRDASHLFGRARVAKWRVVAVKDPYGRVDCCTAKCQHHHLSVFWI